MAGITVAKIHPVPSAIGLGLLLAAASVLAAGATVAAWRGFRGATWIWGGGIVFAAGLAGFVVLHLRYPHLHDPADRPIREVTVTLESQRVFPGAADARTLSGLGRVIAADAHNAELVGQPVYFSVIKRISAPPRQGGHYVLTGVLEPLPVNGGADDFSAYLKSLGIRHRLTRAHAETETRAPGRSRQFCARAETHLEAILRLGPRDHAQITSLYLAMLLGEKAELSPQQEAAFMRSGTFHIFSISGLHVGVIAAALYVVLQFLRLPSWLLTIVSLTLLWLYVQITGGSAPAERAFLMIAFLMASRIARLPGNPLAALAAAALVTLLGDPMQLFNTGFQMSYGVVAALIMMAVPLSERLLAGWRPFALLPKDNWRWHHHLRAGGVSGLIGSGAVSWVAFLASTPAGIGYFNLLSFGALAANLIIIPLSSLAIIAGFISLLTGLVGLSPISAVFNYAATVILIVMDWLVRHGTTIPGMYFDAAFRQPWMAPAAMALMTATLLAGVAGRWRSRYGGFWTPAVVLALILIFSVKFGAP